MYSYSDTQQRGSILKNVMDCSSCRSEFTAFNRKHHCRCCGKIFCWKCSSKTSPVLKFGIENNVRVCDQCFCELEKQAERLNRQEKTDEAFDEKLQLAIVLSQSEQESKTRASNADQTKIKTFFPKRLDITMNDLYGVSEAQLNEPPIRYPAKKGMNTSGAVQQPQQQHQQLISSPSPPPSAPFIEAKLSNENAQEHNDETTQPMNIFIEEIKKYMDIFDTRMESDQLRGRTVTNDTAVQSLFLQLQQLHPKLLAYIKFQEDARGYFESLHDKLTRLKDAREALNVLRYEHFEKKRREAEERKRLKQLQLNAKLTDMRQKKHLYFQMQTEQNLKRFQEQELQLRLEHQRMLVSIRDQQFISGLQFQVNQTPMINPTPIFISYAHADREIVERVYNRLNPLYRTWIDFDQIRTGQYCTSNNCVIELNMAMREGKILICIILEDLRRPFDPRIAAVGYRIDILNNIYAFKPPNTFQESFDVIFNRLRNAIDAELRQAHQLTTTQQQQSTPSKQFSVDSGVLAAALMKATQTQTTEPRIYYSKTDITPGGWKPR